MTPSRSAVDDHLPVKPVVFQILLALGEGEAYGYGIICAVREHSGGRIPLETGPFYRHLRKLLDNGLVAEALRRPAGDDPRRGAYYRLTKLGREVVSAESRRLAGLVAQSRKLGLMTGPKTP